MSLIIEYVLLYFTLFVYF